MEEFGLFAKQLKVKVTNEIKKFDRAWRIPCSMGFRQQDKTYVNEWIDLVVFQDLIPQCEGIEKGDYLTVFGRLTLTEYTDKKGERKSRGKYFALRSEATKSPLTENKFL